jgi:hypothetical protein
MVERKYQQGERVKVVAHETSISGIPVFREGFFGTVIKEYESKGTRYVELEGEGKYQGYRVIHKEFVVPYEATGPETNLEYDGEFYIITCSCGNLRKIKSQHANQVKRCKECQKEHNKKTAKARYRRRRR